MFTLAESILARAVGPLTPAAQLVIYHQGKVIYHAAFGFIDPETRTRPTRLDSLFDLASLTKLYTTTAFMTLVEEGRIQLDDPLCLVLPEFRGMRPIAPYENPLAWNETIQVSNARENVDAARITFRQILAHNSGLPAWRPFKDQPDSESAYRMALETPFAYPPGERVLYSDVGLILLGLAISRLLNLPLDEAIQERVTRPLGLSATRFLPPGSVRDCSNIAPTEFCAWRGRRICGEVHDENAWRLGGVAGHAGLFSNALEVAAFGQSFLDASLLRRETIAEMTGLQAESGAVRRGIGFALWSPDPQASSNPFSQRTFGHTGFTGTSVWIDPARALVVALLTNDVYGGRHGRGIAELRVQVHRAIAAQIPPEET